MNLQIIPSVFSENEAEYQERFKIAIALARRVHVDVMDGKFVKKKSPKLSSLHKIQGQKLEVHLMVEKPIEYLAEIKALGATRVYLHVEAYKTREKLLQDIFSFKEAKIQVGLAVNPSTPVSKVKHCIDSIDAVLLMSIKPGEEGQTFLNPIFDKITVLRKMTQKELGVDGGVKKDLLDRLEREGINFAVVGSAIFS